MLFNSKVRSCLDTVKLFADVQGVVFDTVKICARVAP
jgi:hypothetical protein